MELKKLSKSVLKLWYIHGAIISLALVGVFTSSAAILNAAGASGNVTLAVLLGVGIPVVLLLGITLILPALRYKMYSWGYDENGWPSGFVGGKLLETKEFRVHYLDSSIGDFDENATFHYLIDGNNVIRQETCSNATFINVYEKESVSLADIMNGEVVDAFIRETHERYKVEVPNLKDNVVGFFTDEPLYTEHQQTPYTRILPAYYLERYGEDIFDKLGLLFFEGVGYEKFRYRYMFFMRIFQSRKLFEIL